ncbi:MAG: S-adenosylmethionine:tRNA ribosyltransferase-isomerase [Prevotellaceae bacterium]|nr:S-adenosylmethionine:tRNA ribosyltransferase-isomerase [Prevotellaceae bacterium]
MNRTSEKQALSIDNFDYKLPGDRIANYPLSPRDSSKLLVYKNGEISESLFSSVAGFLPEKSLLVYNNTKVIQARLEFRKPTGARIEVFCLEPEEPADYAQSLSAAGGCVWKCMVGNLKKWKEASLSKTIRIKDDDCRLNVELQKSEGNMHSIRFSWDDTRILFADILEAGGELPIPPYLHRKTEASDYESYQTIYSKIKGSVAAPTAGLHFTDRVFEELKRKNIRFEELTLHVGAGTFQPVKTRNVAEHHMHTETIAVGKNAIEHIQQNLGNIIAVGTTSVRTLESLYFIGAGNSLNPPQGKFFSLHAGQWEAYENEYNVSAHEALQRILDYMTEHDLSVLHADTQIMIKPGYKFRVVDGMITNFHQPKSTLLLLVSAFVNGKWKEIYDYALRHDFRFLSYGDSSLLLP